MVDSIKLVEDNYTNRIHSTRPSGKLHKGHNVTAATSSIPSKYQTVVIDNSDRKGFSSKSRRFNYDGGSNANPGPGQYVGHREPEKISTSFSKKGTGGFASKDRRIMKQKFVESPGPGAYGLPTFMESRNMKSFNKATATSAFHKPIAQKRDDVGKTGPGPNSYDVMKSKQGKSNNVGAAAAFRSQSKRDAFNVGEAGQKPAPWQYHVNDELVRANVRVPLSSFKSKTERKMQNDPPPNPGPGTYKPNEDIDPVDRTVFPRKHYLCISAPAMPLPKTPPSPGPGSYELVNYDGISKHYMSGSNFVSTTSRWTGDPRNMAEVPGPAHYRPTGVGKQSFIYNAQSRWI